MDILSRTISDFFSNTEVWHVRSTHVVDVLRVCISAPELPIAQGTKAGAVYATDAPWLGGALVNLIRACGYSSELPPLYAISIGYPLNRQPIHMIQRTRDLTPTPQADFDPVLPLILGSTDIVPSGSADAFLAFLLDELRPVLEAQFPIDPAEATLTGMSLGGLFTLHAFLSKPQSFRRYLPISPALWWDDRLLLQRAEAQVSSSNAPTAQIYMCAGELEGLEHVRAQFEAMAAEIRAMVPHSMAHADIHGDMRTMGKILSRWQGNNFRACAHIYPEETHNSIVGVALSRGLRTLHGTLPW